MSKIISEIEKEQMKQDLPAFSAGDTVVVKVFVTEGSRTRQQAFEGVVIAKKNRGLNSSFTVRKISYGEGVERTFQTHSPQIASIEVKRRGAVRQAKIYYLRDLTGKAARIKEKIDTKDTAKTKKSTKARKAAKKAAKKEDTKVAAVAKEASKEDKKDKE